MRILSIKDEILKGLRRDTKTDAAAKSKDVEKNVAETEEKSAPKKQTKKTEEKSAPKKQTKKTEGKSAPKKQMNRKKLFTKW